MYKVCIHCHCFNCSRAIYQLESAIISTSILKYTLHSTAILPHSNPTTAILPHSNGTHISFHFLSLFPPHLSFLMSPIPLLSSKFPSSRIPASFVFLLVPSSRIPNPPFLPPEDHSSASTFTSAVTD